MTYSWRSPEGWEVTGERYERFSLLSDTLFVPVQWKASIPGLSQGQAEYLVARRRASVHWGWTASMTAGRYQVRDVELSSGEARAIIGGANPLDVLLPAMTVRVLTITELVTR